MSAPAGVAVALALHSLFSDHAVLQADAPLRLRGTAAPGEAIEVTLAGESGHAIAGGDGQWLVEMAPHAAGGPFDLVATGSQGRRAEAHGLWLGEVWLCSGQSNMEMQVRRVANLEAEIAGADHPRLHLLHVPQASRDLPQAAFGGEVAWQLATPASVRDFSAACYFMGRELERATGAHIGLIDSSWGGSDIKAWLGEPVLRSLRAYDAGLDLLALHARDAAAGEAGWHRLMEDWWATRDAALVGEPAWSTPAFDDAAWPRLVPSGIWEDSGIGEFRNFDGVAWFRTGVELDAAQAAAARRLQLGPIDDADRTWVNGREVGGLEGWNVPRDYALPAGLLHAGRNEIAVRVLDTGGGGGLWGAPAARRLVLADGSALPLPAEWRYRVAGSLARLGSPPHAPWMAPVGLATLGNGMIAPLDGISLRGIAWYQGETNVYDAAEYRRLLAALIGEWRARFGAGIPFLVVQLAGFGPANAAPVDSAWAALREAQRAVVDADARAGLAVTIDIGDRQDIHPTNKQEVGRRLGLLARHLAHGAQEEYAGPAPIGARRAGRLVVIDYAHAQGGLRVEGNGRPVGFELCDARSCRYVDASASGRTVTLDATSVPGARRVRYAWADSPVVNLVNADGLPAVPFELELARGRSGVPPGGARR